MRKKREEKEAIAKNVEIISVVENSQVRIEKNHGLFDRAARSNNIEKVLKVIFGH